MSGITTDTRGSRRTRDPFLLSLYNAVNNPNMPLRFLIYVAKEYQKLIRNHTLYASTLVELPTPHFVVFYNGEEEQEAESELRLAN